MLDTQPSWLIGSDSELSKGEGQPAAFDHPHQLRRPPSLDGDRLASPWVARHSVVVGWSLLGPEAVTLIPAEEWDALSSAALCENPFYSRQYVLAGMETIDREVGIEAVAVRGDGGRLLGLFPFRRRWGVAFGAANLYQFSGAPLVHRDYASAAVSAWMDGMIQGDLPSVWSLHHLQLGSDLANLIADQARLGGLRTVVVNAYRRPRLTRKPGGVCRHIADTFSKARRKGIERSIRRLRELGNLRFEHEAAPEAVRARLAQFLDLERAGWKGAGRTAFLSRPDHAAFARAAFGGRPGREGLASTDTLLLDEVAIAISLNICSGDTAFTPKSTYDERLRRLNPGVVLEQFIIEHFYEAGPFADMDASTTVDGHLLQGLWNDEMLMGNLLVGRSGRTNLVADMARERERLKQRAKRILARVHSRR